MHKSGGRQAWVLCVADGVRRGRPGPAFMRSAMKCCMLRMVYDGDRLCNVWRRLTIGLCVMDGVRQVKDEQRMTCGQSQQVNS